MKLRTLLTLGLMAGLVALAGSACTSTPPEPAVVENLSAPEMVQRAQERSDLNDYEGAALWYTAAIEKFADDVNIVTMCRYEIAFLRYKQGKYDEARQLFQALIDDYNGPDGRNMPPRFFALAQRVLQGMENQ
ncbi:MAG TPA: hypothetical protein DD477_02270 [Spirochaetaceae bacterium]|nr:hypothetical protein [Spirochaetaceae bacterium]HAW84711.1 hypothetical protein [Spirochaetaceae bacterium]HAX36295.1 hypothetical protein [Spirochaetaceae bacterium]HBO40027.1 hypothetical protein [Spirochaetaceae bacterium]HCQ88348.1 hypothetical protein [Spirochaetaceae bacterium]